jgi:hypothetical protein
MLKYLHSSRLNSVNYDRFELCTEIAEEVRKFVVLGTILCRTPWSSPSEATNNPSDSQEFPRLLYNPKVHYHVHKTALLLPTLFENANTNEVSQEVHYIESELVKSVLLSMH